MRKQTSIILNRSELEGILFGMGVALGPDWEVEGLEDGGISIFWGETIFPTNPLKFPFSLSAKLPQGLTDQIRSFCQNSEKIKAIKEVRSFTGWGLRESKDWVDENFPTNPPF